MDDGNDDVIAVESSSGSGNMENEKPLMGLINRLIGNKKSKKSNIVLTNAQITFILEKEFDMPVSSLHTLEQLIYMNVLKKFLKVWPLWEEFDNKIKDLRRQKNNEEVLNNLLESKYNHLKMYLKTMLDVSGPLVKQKISELPVKEKMSISTKDKDNDVVMEVMCTRSQLTTLFNNRPTKDGALFNISPIEPSRIRVCHIPYKSLLNWWCFSINITCNSIQLKRETCHELKHLLINKQLSTETTQSEILKRSYQEKQIPYKQDLSKKDLFKVFNDLREFTNNTQVSYICTLLDVILMDLEDAPSMLKAPGLYRQYMSEYPYVRYLCTEVDVDPNSGEAKKYDIQLQETISPMFQLWLGKTSVAGTAMALAGNVSTVNDVFIECKECKLKFYTSNMLQALEQHLWESHAGIEADWTCVHCKNSYPMITLAEQRWKHVCKTKVRNEFHNKMKTI